MSLLATCSQRACVYVSACVRASLRVCVCFGAHGCTCTCVLDDKLAEMYWFDVTFNECLVAE